MKFAAFAMLASMSVAGCAATAPQDVVPAFNPADPIIGIRDVHYHPVVVDYQHRNPVGPQDWRRLNERLSPSNGGQGS
jgi:hypothetical protein